MQLREKLSEFETRNVRLACVVQGTAEEAAGFCGRHGLENVCIPDPEKESYRAMEFGKTSWKEMIFASDDLRRRRQDAKKAGVGVSLKGTFQKHSDVHQLPGAAFVAAGGRILWLHRGTHTGDLPPADALLKIVERHAPR